MSQKVAPRKHKKSPHKLIYEGLFLMEGWEKEPPKKKKLRVGTYVYMYSIEE